MKLILASASPRRKELLSYLGYEYEIIVANVDEDILQGEDSLDYVRRISHAKCKVVSEKHPNCAVLSADTTVVLGDEILGKPIDQRDAEWMLSQLSGRRHRVCTAFSIYSPNTKIIETEVVETIVSFRDLSSKEIENYVFSGDAMDKAGSYGFQNAAIAFISEIEGSPSNVIGLPLCEVSSALKKIIL